MADLVAEQERKDAAAGKNIPSPILDAKQTTSQIEMAIKWTDFQTIRRDIDSYVSTWWSGPNIVLLIPKQDRGTQLREMLSAEGIRVYHPLQVKKILATGKRNDGGNGNNGRQNNRHGDNPDNRR